MQGLVTKTSGSLCLVLPDGGGDMVACRVKGNFRIRGIRTTNPVAVGDRVTFTPPAPGSDEGFITAIEPRRNYIIRRASNLSKESHIIAANIDEAFLIVSLAHPTTSTTFIDRFLATAEAYGIPATIVVNKTDLLIDEDDRQLLDALCYLYRSIGYNVLTLSALSGHGIEQLRERLAGKISLLSGNSGVGKSTIINDLIPGLGLRTAEVSAVHDSGMHTTTFSEMYPLPDMPGSWIIDTPGVRGFGTIDFDRYQTAHYFPEIFKASRNCRFDNCTHTHEPGCAVREALERSEIAQSRYSSYLSILDDSSEDKYRKPF